MFRKTELINQRPEVRDQKSENRVGWMGILLLCVSILVFFHLVSSLAFAQKKSNITLLIHQQFPL